MDPLRRMEESAIEGMPTRTQILDATSNGIIATDAVGSVVFINKQAENILGFDEKDTLGAYISDILPLTGPLVIQCLKTGAPQLGHHILGENVSLVVNVTKIGRGRRVVGAACNFMEMREFEHVARRLESYKNLNRQLSAIFRSSSDGIWVCDGKGTVININEASEDLNGIQAKDTIGKNIIDVVKSGLFDRSVTLEVMETKRQVSILQYVQRTKKYLLVTGTPAFDDEGDLFLIVVNERDMTQLNAIRDQLVQTRMVTEKFKDEIAELSMMELKKQQIIAGSKEMRQVLRVALKLAHLEANNILLLGESGTGKGLLAKFIHKNSKRGNKPFIQINCAALPESLLEAELFGYEKGAFTGARAEGKVGLFELSHEGTLFLDEIGDLPPSIQAKLLKYLDDHEVTHLGGLKAKKIECKIIAATNRNLERLVRRRSFRQDLFYRLNTFTLKIPPLRERAEDIFDLAEHYLGKYNKRYGSRKLFTPRSLEAMQAYPFPGNVRELKSVLKKAVVMSERETLDDFMARNLEEASAREIPSDRGKKERMSLPEEVYALERKILKDALTRCKSTREIAKLLGTSQPTIVRKLKKHHLSTLSIQK